MKRKKNEFFDINKFPSEEGILLFGISMPQIGNIQSAKKCFEYIKYLIPKILVPSVGLSFVYSDWLYMYSDEKAYKLKNKFQGLMNSHKNEFIKILNKQKWYVRKSFNFFSWSQLILEAKDFTKYYGEILKQYKNDKNFKRYVYEDIKRSKKKVNKNSIHYILEEILIFYLSTKGKIRFPNEYVQDKEKWVLNCYPGKPLKSEIYLHQKNFLKVKNPKNKYENCYYDLEEKKLYDFDNVDLETIKL